MRFGPSDLPLQAGELTGVGAGEGGGWGGGLQ